MIRHLIRRWIRIDHGRGWEREAIGGKIHVTVMQAEGTKRMWLEKTGEIFKTGIAETVSRI